MRHFRIHSSLNEVGKEILLIVNIFRKKKCKIYKDAANFFKRDKLLFFSFFSSSFIISFFSSPIIDNLISLGHFLTWELSMCIFLYSFNLNNWWIIFFPHFFLFSDFILLVRRCFISYFDKVFVLFLVLLQHSYGWFFVMFRCSYG
jgi:hypothetical protein